MKLGIFRGPAQDEVIDDFGFDIASPARRFRGALVVLFVFLSIGLAAGIVLFDQMESVSQSLRRMQADNTTWRATQLESDHQRLRLAIYSAQFSRDQLTGVPGREAWQTVSDRFDEYYARLTDVGLLAQRTLKEDADSRALASELSVLRGNRSRLADIIDDTLMSRSEKLDRMHSIVTTDVATVRSAMMYFLQGINSLLMAEQQAGNSLGLLSRKFLTIFALVFFVAMVTSVYLSRRFALAAVRLDAIGSRLSTIIRSSPDAVVACDFNGRIFAWNAAAERLTGYSRADIQTTNFVEKIAPLRHMRRLMPAGLSNRPDFALEHVIGHPLRIPIRRKSGQIIQIEVTTAVDDGPAGRIAIIFGRDLTTSIREQRRIRRARGDALLLALTRERFLSEMSHEMRTPLHGVVAALDLAVDKSQEPELARLLEVARLSALGALEQIDGVLETARSQHNANSRRQPGFIPANCARRVVDEMAVLAGTRSNTIELLCDPNSRLAHNYNPRAFHRALANLVSNACKFTRDGAIYVRLIDRTAEILRVEVEDSGIGIDPESLPDIFRDYVTGDAEGWGGRGGSGLGLPIFARAVRELSGRFGVHSTPGEGSLFWFEIPCSNLALGGDAPSPTIASHDITFPLSTFTQTRSLTSLSGGRPLEVLIVDDNPVNRELLCNMVARMGHHTVVASDGLAAATAAVRKRFDLVLTDIRMPGVDGYRTAAIIREGGASQDATIIGVTAHLNQFASERAAAAAAGFAAFLIKPFTLAELSRVIEQHVGTGAILLGAAGSMTVIDPERVDILKQMSGEQNYDALMQETMASIADIAVKLDVHPPGTNDTELADEVHNLIGTSAALGLVALCTELRQCEDVLRGHATADVPALRKASADAVKAAARYRQVA
jgi:PAS domain S-box-containing protein